MPALHCYICLCSSCILPREAAAKRRADCKAAVLKLAQQACDAERQLSEFKLRADGLRLGTIGAQRTGPLGVQPFHPVSKREKRLP